MKTRLLPVTELLLLAAAISLGGCASEEEPDGATDAGATPTCTSTELDWGRGGGDMLPGTDCIDCHQPGGHAVNVFTVAGTVFQTTTCPTGVEGVVIQTQDSAGATLELTSNAVGNFYANEPLTPPFRFFVEAGGVTTPMVTATNSGSCGACHMPESDLGLLAAGP